MGWLTDLIRRLRGSGETTEDPKGTPLALDPDAESSDPGEPAFFARPSWAPVYHGFPILEDVEFFEFRLGMIADFLSAPITSGDAFIVAPDNSRAGIIWEAEVEEAYFEEVIPAESDRWGVFAIGTEHSLTTVEDAQLFLEGIVHTLFPYWASWKDNRTKDFR